MEGLVKKSFSANLRVMRLLGFYPPQKYRKLYKIYAYGVYCFFTILIPALASLKLLLETDISLAQISENAFLVCQTGCFVVKFLPFIKSEDQIRRSIFTLECPLFAIYTKKQETIINECIEICRRNCRVFLSVCTITFFFWAITPFFMGGFKLPMDIWLPFDNQSGLGLYLFSFAFVVAGVGNGALSSGVIDPLLAGLASHATSQIKVLKNNLEYLDEHAEEKIINIMTNSTTEKEHLKAIIIYDKVRLCVCHHNAILDFVQVYENTYSASVFIQFAASVLVICISCLQLSMVEPFTFTFFAMILFVSTMLCEIFLYCYYGTILYEESNTLTDAIYMGKWYEYDMKSQKVLLTLIERSKRPMIVTAGKILDLSLQTFTTILRRAYSLLAVLKNY
ncbi:7tm 6 domain containing protein [Asbolus verrucosus]|uniref:Odorant receptor n=1 Tax=Asbolus verrucosus TaxID=1661398 RepID=A0A482VZJ5_ASBVE|nr:7tm 6 domain containing protein [Asbolus verrucosus]